MIAKSYLKNGYSFLVLCAKVDEAERWKKYARETGREQDLVVFNQNSGLAFNFLQYEMQRSGAGAGDVINLNRLLQNVNELSKIFHGDNGGSSERFWDNAVQRLISNAIMFLKIAGAEISIANIRRLISDSFQEEDLKYYHLLNKLIRSAEEIEPQKRMQARADYEVFRQSNFFLGLLEKINGTDLSEEQQQDFELLKAYWLKDFALLSEKTRSIVVESFMGIIEPFLNDGILRRHFTGGLSDELIPENCIANNKIVIIDFPIKAYGLAGTYAATIIKTAFQQALERRNIERETNPKPMALWIDEYQNFCNPLTDSMFQLTARSSWVASVYITQNINNLRFVMGNINLKIFCSNADFDTNEWASQMIGKHYVEVQNLNYDKDMHMSKSKSKELRDKVAIDMFTKLKTGKKENRYIVEAVVFKSGKVWGKNGDNFAIVKFDQRM